MWLGTDSI